MLDPQVGTCAHGMRLRIVARRAERDRSLAGIMIRFRSIFWYITKNEGIKTYGFAIINQPKLGPKEF